LKAIEGNIIQNDVKCFYLKAPEIIEFFSLTSGEVPTISAIQQFTFMDGGQALWTQE
jgi:hypothetical protein